MQKREEYPSPRKKHIKTYKANILINKNALNFFEPYERKRAKERIFLTPSSNDKKNWEACNQEQTEQCKPNGTYAYVVHTEKVATERQYPSRFVAWSIPEGKHNTTFHFGLSGFAKEVTAAGECRFRNGELIYFDRGSGTYNPDDKIKENAGLPPDAYRPLTYAP